MRLRGMGCRRGMSDYAALIRPTCCQVRNITQKDIPRPICPPLLCKGDMVYKLDRRHGFTRLTPIDATLGHG